MRKKLLAIIVTGLFLVLAISTFSNVTANKVDKNSTRSENAEDPCSITVYFITNKGEELLENGHFEIDLFISFAGKTYYHDWIIKESGVSSVEIVNLPPGLYKLNMFNFGAGNWGPIMKFVIVGSGTFIPTHKDVTIKIIDFHDD